MGRYKNSDSEIVRELTQMQQLFSNLETDFLEFNEIVPYDHNPDEVYSPKLVNILQNIGPQIYGLFKIISKQLGLKLDNEKFPSYVKSLDELGLLSNQHVLLMKNAKAVKPFQLNETNYEWWDSYNSVKHDLPHGIFEAKYVNVINSLGALYILHHIADAIQTKKNDIIEKENILDSSNWLHVLTLGNYYHYKSERAKGTSLYETFQSKVFVIGKRFLPHMKEQNVVPDFDKIT